MLLVLLCNMAYAQSNKIEKEYLTALAESLDKPEMVRRVDKWFLSKCLGEEAELSSQKLSEGILALLADDTARIAFYKRLNFYMSSTASLYEKLFDITKRETITPSIRQKIDDFTGNYAWISRTEVGISLFKKSDLSEYFKFIRLIGEDKSLDNVCAVNSKEKIYNSTETVLKFADGDTAVMKKLGSMIIYPKLEMDNDIQGKVVVRFVVCEDGSVSNVTVINGVSPGLDKESIRAVRLLPKFTAGIKDGKPVKAYFTIPITYSMH